jgi:hypothetical protein
MAVVEVGEPFTHLTLVEDLCNLNLNIINKIKVVLYCTILVTTLKTYKFGLKLLLKISSHTPG